MFISWALRAEKRSGPRIIVGLSSTLETPRRSRTVALDSLPLPTLPSPKHSGKVVLETRLLQREAQRQRQALLLVEPGISLSSPQKFPHLRPCAQFLGYRVPAAAEPGAEAEYVERNNRIDRERRKLIEMRAPEYAYCEPHPMGTTTKSKKSTKVELKHARHEHELKD